MAVHTNETKIMKKCLFTGKIFQINTVLKTLLCAD